MTKNVGKIDQIVRVILALVIAYLDWTGAITGVLSYVLSAVAVVMVATAFLKFCPLYKLIGVNTCQASDL